MYGLMMGISLFVRQFCLPNPFECFGDSAILINWIAEPIMQIVSYGLVGLVYHKGEAPALGSFLYLLTYTTLTGILWVLGQVSFAWWAIAGMVAAIIGLMILIAKIRGDSF